MNNLELMIYQVFGASIIVGLIKNLIQVLIIALGVYLGNRWSARKAKKLSQKANNPNT